MKLLNLFSFTVILLLILCDKSFSQVRWEKVSDRPAGVTDFKIFPFYENGEYAHYCMSTDGAGLFKSTDGGVTWINVGLNGLTLTDMQVSAGPGTYFVSAEDGIYKSTDYGLNWRHITSGIEGLWITALESSLFIYAGTANNGVYRSTDEGESWTPYNTGMENSSITRIHITAEGEISATTDTEGVWIYNDSLEVWEQKNQGNPNLSNYAITSDPSGNLYLNSTPYVCITSQILNYVWQIDYNLFPNCYSFAVTFDGQVFASSLGFGVIHKDVSGVWEDFSEGLPEDNQGFIDVFTVALDEPYIISEDGSQELYLWAAVTPLDTTVSGGIYKTIDPVATSIENISSEIPEHFVLEQNYPNPFNPTTTINFSIPEVSFVSLKIFNSLGEKVEILVAEELSAGTYKYDWNAINLPSGIYFYRLQAESFIITKKMMLLK